MQKVDKGYFSPPTSNIHPTIHSQTRIYLFTRLYHRVPGCPCPRHSVVSLFIVSRGGFASVRPHSRADHSLGQEPVYLYTPTMPTCKDLRFTRAAQFGKCKMYGESETTDYSVKSHSLWPESSAGGASSAEDQGMKIIMFGR